MAHEINQPVAAIRTYAENAGRFLDSGKTEPVGGNLTSIVSMTERIGAITSTLRTFARRPGVAASPCRYARRSMARCRCCPAASAIPA